MASRDIAMALQVPDFRWLWMGSLASSFAMNMQIIARGWLVYTLTESAMDLAWVTLSFMVPQVAFSLWGGVVADRWPKKHIIVLAQALNCAATLKMMAAALAAAVLVAGCALTGGAEPPAAPADWRAEVMGAERAFAGTMARRDHAAFTGYLAEEAVFFADGGPPLRGKQAVAAAWRPFFEGAEAPFAWRPDQVEVLQSGTLALSTGPVLDPSGRVIGRFNSIWRRESPGVWRVVFDKGSPVCPPEAPTP